MPKPFLWTPTSAADRIVILFGAGAAVADHAQPSLQMPLGDHLADVIRKKAFRNRDDPDAALAEAIRNAGFDRGKLTKDHATFDMIWQALVRTQGKHALADYYEEIAAQFRGKPLPKTYTILAHLFLKLERVTLATVNFDLQIDHAIQQIARLYRMYPLKDYQIACTADDFEFYENPVYEDYRVFLKLHGTLDHPLSILAGLPDHKPAKKHPRRSPPPPPPLIYRRLLREIDRASTVIFIGYSFRDLRLSGYLKTAIAKRTSRRKEVYIICDEQSDSLADRFGRVPQTVSLLPRTETAEKFLDGMILNQPFWNVGGALALSAAERKVLNDGPPDLVVDGSKDPRSPRDREGLESKFEFPDQLYGEVKFQAHLPEINACINSGEFQRLQSIKQLAFVCYKRRGATHTRFAHSLGVAHLTSQFIEFKLAQSDPADDPAVLDMLRGTARLDLVLAALFHDLGHGPLSHTLDTLSGFGMHDKVSAQILRNAQKKEAFGDLSKIADKFGLRLDQVAKIVAGEDPLSVVIDNAGLDMDRLDFILRDLFYISSVRSDSTDRKWLDKVEFIVGKLEILLRSLVLPRGGGYYYRLSEHGEGQVAEDPVYQVLEHLGTAYCQLYDQVYYGWQNSCAQALLAKAIQLIHESRQYRPFDILVLTDDGLFRELERLDDPVAQQLAILAKYRRLHDQAFKVEFKVAVPSFPLAGLEALFNSGERMNWLFAFRKEKSFKVRVLETPLFATRTGVPSEKSFGEPARARLLGFIWPGCEYSPRDVEARLVEFLTRHKFEPKSYTIDTKPHR